MGNTVYQLNRDINRPIEFKGLQGQYIWYMGAGMVGLLLLFAVLYALGVNAFACVALVLGLGALLVHRLFRLSRTYGVHGLMKKLARGRVPAALRVCSRGIFFRSRDLVPQHRTPCNS